MADWAPSVNISESETEYHIEADLPQVKRDDIQLTVEEGVLTIRGERKHQREEKKKKYHRVESAFGSFVRRFTLPENADADKVEASFKDGTLEVTIPKTEPKASKARQIKVG